MKLPVQILLVVTCYGGGGNSEKVRSSCSGLTYLSGDALSDDSDCLGPQGQRYPHEEVEQHLRDVLGVREQRRGRAMGGFSSVMSPSDTREMLLKTHMAQSRVKREAEETDSSSGQCSAPPGLQTPSRLCKTSFNTTAPMYGVSLTSGQPVTIVQKFPDLLQQVIYEACDSKECSVLQGECVQTFIPHLFLVIPLGPVTLTGQDYVLVESGCSCRPKYAAPGGDPNPQDIIPKFN